MLLNAFRSLEMQAILAEIESALEDEYLDAHPYDCTCEDFSVDGPEVPRLHLDQIPGYRRRSEYVDENRMPYYDAYGRDAYCNSQIKKNSDEW